MTVGSLPILFGTNPFRHVIGTDVTVISDTEFKTVNDTYYHEMVIEYTAPDGARTRCTTTLGSKARYRGIVGKRVYWDFSTGFIIIYTLLCVFAVIVFLNLSMEHDPDGWCTEFTENLFDAKFALASAIASFVDRPFPEDPLFRKKTSRRMPRHRIPKLRMIFKEARRIIKNDNNDINE